MAGRSSEKFQIVFEARDAASDKIKQLNKQLAALGGPAMVKSHKEIKRLERQVRMLGGESKKGNILFSRFTQGIAAGNLIAMATSKGLDLLRQGIKQIGKAALVAAQVEELHGVMKFLGRQSRYTTAQLDDYYNQLRKNGIAQKEANQAMLRAIQGNIDLADAVKLGRIAQDAAVIGQMNSSEAYQTLIDAIVKGRVVMLKSLGIQGTFEASYKRMANTLQKTQTELTEAEKLQARLNLVFEGGSIIAGAYETAMGFASKQLRSFDRYIQDLQVSIGQYLTPAFSVLVTEATNAIKAITGTFGTDNDERVKRTARQIGEVVAKLLLVAKTSFNVGQIMYKSIILVFDQVASGAAIVIGSVKNMFSAAAAMAAGFAAEITGNQEAADILYREAAESIMFMKQVNRDLFSDMKTSANQASQGILSDIDDMVAAVRAYEETVESLGKTTEEKFVKPIVKIPEAADEGLLKLEDTIEMTTSSTYATINRVQALWNASVGRMKQSLVMFVSSSVDALVDGRANFAEIFKGMAADFIKFFIKKALIAVTSKFIPGLGSLLGGMFDTPVNDKMAMQQGEDFMKWFTAGAIKEARGGSVLAANITGSQQTTAPIEAAYSGGSGNVVMNVTVSGNVMSGDFIEKEIAPTLHRLVTNGRSQLSIQNPNKTGRPDVIIS